MVPSLEIMHTDSMADTLYTKTIKSKKKKKSSKIVLK